MNTGLPHRVVTWSIAPLLAVGIATAQGQSQKQYERPQKQVKDTKQQEKREAQAMSTHFITLDEAQGMEVYSFSEQELGEVDDLIIERETGRVAYMLIGHGGTLGLGETLTAVPYHAFDVNVQNQKPQLRLNVTEQELSDAPEFDRKQWSKANHDDWDAELRREWKKWTDDTDLPQRDRDREMSENRDRQRDMQQQKRDQQTAKSARFILGSELEGADVRCGSTSRTDCGTLDAIVFECISGEIAFYSIESSSDLLDIGEANRIVPLEVASIDRDGQINLSITSKQLDNGVEMPDATSRLNDSTYRSTVYQNYNVKERDFGKQARGWNKPGDMHDQKPRIVHGEIVRMTTVKSPNDPGEELQAIVISTPDGEQTICLAPKSYMEEHGITLRKGQRVGVDVLTVTERGQTMHLARSLMTSENRYQLRDRSGDATWKRPRRE